MISIVLILLRYQNHEDWEKLLNKTWSDAENFVKLIEQIARKQTWRDAFQMRKYGTYYRNIHGIIEHTHYHLGQIVLIKKDTLAVPRKIAVEIFFFSYPSILFNRDSFLKIQTI
jgi:hypothetical protein